MTSTDAIAPTSSWWHASTNDYVIVPGVNDRPHTVKVTRKSTGLAKAVRLAMAAVVTFCISILAQVFASSLDDFLRQLVVIVICMASMVYFAHLFSSHGTTWYVLPKKWQDNHREQIAHWLEAYPDDFPVYARRARGSLFTRSEYADA
jgi:hypothetical protein